MASEIGVSEKLPKRQAAAAPYAPGIIDRFMAWADSLPGSAWTFYLVLLGTLVVIFNGVAWLAGIIPFGRFDLYRTSVPVYPVAILALMHYLNIVASRALVRFRPALGKSEAEYSRLEYELTVLPARQTWASLILSLPFTAAYLVFTPSIAEVMQGSPWLVGVDAAIYVVVFGVITVFVYQTLRRLRMVSDIHARAQYVNLFHPAPLYAFSGLTAQTGISLILLDYFSVITDPTTFVNPALIGLTIFTALGAIACFVLPLKGMHDRIATEKARLRSEANARLQATIQRLYQRADANDLSGIEQLNELLASLVTTRDVMAKLPTWPWETATLAGFVSVFVVPFIIGLVVVLLEHFLF